MRKAILVQFIRVLLAALLLNSIIFYIASSSQMLKTARKDMLYTLEALDCILDYRGELDEQIKQMDEVIGKNQSRLTIIRADGRVAADTGVDASGMDNHLAREEVVEAIRTGRGHAARYSRTLNKTMLYVAVRSSHQDLILRLGVPFLGIREYLILLLPAAWLSFAIAILVSLGVTDRLVSSVTGPILKLAQEMKKVRGNAMDLEVTISPYEEINLISTTAAEMSARLKQYVQQLEKERKIRQEFFSNASHELKTPLTSIQGYAELLEQDNIRDESLRQDFIRRMKTEAVHMTSLINDILTISRLEANEIQAVVSAVDMQQLLSELMLTLEPLAKELEISITVDCPPMKVEANPQYMYQLCQNLISNAIKYNHPGGQVWVNVSETDENLILSIKDNGMGIPKKDQERIFERFYRVDKGRSRKQGGTGLGLSIVKHIVSYAQGNIEVSSAPGQGSCFTVTLPVRQTQHTPVALPK